MSKLTSNNIFEGKRQSLQWKCSQQCPKMRTGQNDLNWNEWTSDNDSRTLSDTSGSSKCYCLMTCIASLRQIMLLLFRRRSGWHPEYYPLFHQAVAHYSLSPPKWRWTTAQGNKHDSMQWRLLNHLSLHRHGNQWQWTPSNESALKPGQFNNTSFKWNREQVFWIHILLHSPTQWHK